jgi:DNA-directed RNA polymerase specialized sigma54-like protein
MPVTGQKQSLQINQNTGQYIRVEQSNLMQMSQSELDSLILEIERTKLFNRLFKEEKIIRYNRFNKADISRKFYTLDESVIAGTQSPEIEILLLDKKRIIECIRELGLEKFKRYFLLPEDGLSESEIAISCGLSVSRVCEINNLVNDIAVMDEFYSLSSLNSNDINYTKIASIEMDKNGFRVSYLLNSMARGQYIINYEKFEQSELKKGMNAGEIRDVRALFKKLEMLNRCKETLHLILDNAIEKQAAYLESGNAKELLPLSQKELAVKIGVHPGTLSRAIRDRTIEIPCGKEITLKSLFPNPRKFRMMMLKDAVGSEEGAYSDAKIQKKLAEEYGINISRRTVANIRKELKIPAGGAR